MSENEIKNRKIVRLKNYNYSSKGAYFITVCTKDRRPILSEIVSVEECIMVGDGAHDVPSVRLTNIGKIVEKYLLSSERIPGVKIDKYVIMPEHIHVIVLLSPDEYSFQANGTSRAPSPTNKMIPHIVSTFKRLCNKEIGENIFQRSYMDHIIRDKDDYDTKCKYIYENPKRRYFEK